MEHDFYTVLVTWAGACSHINGAKTWSFERLFGFGLVPGEDARALDTHEALITTELMNRSEECRMTLGTCTKNPNMDLKFSKKKKV